MNRRLPRLLRRGCLLVMLLLAPAAAIGSTDPGFAELMSEADRLIRLGDLKQAITHLEKAVELEPENQQVRFRLGSVLASLGRFEEATPVFAALVAIDPQNSAARRGEITGILIQGDYRQARRKLEEGLVALPRDGQIAHTLARLVATAPLDAVRDGELALQLALKVYEVVQSYETGETVAMAYAEAGRFEDAIAQQRQLIAMAERDGDSQRLESLNERLLTYLRNEPWRAKSPTEIAMATEPPRAAGPR